MKIYEKAFEIVPIGTYTSLCYRYIDLGTQRSDPQYGAKLQRTINLAWELPDELMESGLPFTIGRSFNAVLGEKSSLGGLLKSWLGGDIPNGFELTSVVARPGNLTAVHETKNNGKIKAKVASVTPLKKGEKAPPLINPVFIFDMASTGLEGFDKVPEFYQEIIKKSPEYLELSGNGDARAKIAEGLDDEVPF